MMRYALYFTPDPDSDLYRFGTSVIGYDAVTGERVPFRDLGQDDWDALTAEPRRYGFHATLKAPFHLAAGQTEAGLIAAMQHFAEAAPAVRLDGLETATIGPFCALVPVGSIAALGALAGSVVTRFEPFRAPLTAADRQRRLNSPLSSRQIQYLDLYGYPYVLDEFRFHMTLTGPIHADRRDEVRDALERAHGEDCAPGPVTIDRVVLFRQDDAAARFRILAAAPLSRAAVPG